MVRKGIKNGLNSEFDPGVERFFALFADNVHRQGTPALPRRYFALLRETFGDDCRVLTVLDAQGAPVSSVLSLLLAGRSAARITQATRWPRASSRRTTSSTGSSCATPASAAIEVFDYGRSKRGTGSFDFKKNWGFEPQPLHYEYLLVKGQARAGGNPLNPEVPPVHQRVAAAAARRSPT